MFDKLKKLFSAPPVATPAAIPPAVDSIVSPLPEQAPDETTGNAFLCREAVFDRGGRLAGRLFRLRGTPLQADADSRGQQRTDQLLLRSLAAGSEAWNNSLAFVPLSSRSLSLPLLDELPAQNLVLLLHLAAEDIDGVALAARLEELRRRGIAIGIYRQPKHAVFGSVIGHADIGAVDVSTTEPGIVRDFSAAFRAAPRSHKATLFGGQIATMDEHRLCHLWHFDYFHGAFAASTPLHDDNSATDPHKVQLLHLLRLVQGDGETAEIVAALKQDPPLAFRILRYLNSPLLGLDHRIESLGQALTILGRQRLARWLSVLLFSVHDPGFGDWLLVESALTRGRMMEIIGATLLPRAPADALFLTGIFSCLDKLLRRPLAELLDEIPLAPEVRSALLEGSGPYAPLLALTEAAETFDLARMESAARAVLVPADTVNEALLAATAWACEVSEHWE